MFLLCRLGVTLDIIPRRTQARVLTDDCRRCYPKGNLIFKPRAFSQSDSETYHWPSKAVEAVESDLVGGLELLEDFFRLVTELFGEDLVGFCFRQVSLIDHGTHQVPPATYQQRQSSTVQQSA